MKKVGIAMIVILGIIIVALLCILIFVPMQKDLTAGWKTYQNAQDAGFSLKYPDGAIVREGDPGGLYFPMPVDFPLITASVQFPRVDTFSENGSHGYYEFQVRVAAAAPGKLGWGCNAKAAGNDWPADPATTTINGQLVYVFKGSEAGAGNRMETTRYALCTGDNFYNIYDLFASGSDGTPLTPKLEADIAAGKARNAEIIKTFKFLEP